MNRRLHHDASKIQNIYIAADVARAARDLWLQRASEGADAVELRWRRREIVEAERRLLDVVR